MWVGTAGASFGRFAVYVVLFNALLLDSSYVTFVGVSLLVGLFAIVLLGWFVSRLFVCRRGCLGVRLLFGAYCGFVLCWLVLLLLCLFLLGSMCLLLSLFCVCWCLV